MCLHFEQCTCSLHFKFGSLEHLEIGHLQKGCKIIHPSHWTGLWQTADLLINISVFSSFVEDWCACIWWGDVWGPPKSGCLTFLSKTNATSHQLAPTSLPYLCTKCCKSWWLTRKALSRVHTSTKKTVHLSFNLIQYRTLTSNCTLSQIHST